MKIVITGSEGFIGRVLREACAGRGIEFSGVDGAAAPGAKYDYRRADIRSDSIAEAIPTGADAIVHLAALSRDPDCKNRAYECFDANVMGTLNLMRAAEARGVRQFIFASSEWVYGEFVPGEVKTEDSPIEILKLTSEYALSKVVSEANIRQKFAHGFCNATILRFGIVYGPRPQPGSAVESLFRAAKSGGPISIGSRGTGRCFIHVADLAAGILASLGLPGLHTLNLCGDRFIPLGEIIDRSAAIWGTSPAVSETSPGSVSVRNISNAKTKKVLDWRPVLDLDAGLKSLQAA